jgi:hypothetical protein
MECGADRRAPTWFGSPSTSQKVSRSSLRIQFTQTAARGRPTHRLAQCILSASREFHPHGSSSSQRKCTRPASLPATMMRPSAQAQRFTPASQADLATSAPVSRSQTLRVLSREAETARPSDVTATPKTQSAWLASVRNSPPVSEIRHLKRLVSGSGNRADHQKRLITHCKSKTASPGLGIEFYSCILLATRNGNQQESNIAPVAAVTKVTLDAQVLR